MKSALKHILATAAFFVGTTQLAHADFLPEPGTLPLVGLAIAAAVFVVRRRK